jgi:hypothetical protein
MYPFYGREGHKKSNVFEEMIASAAPRGDDRLLSLSRRRHARDGLTVLRIEVDQPVGGSWVAAR